MSGFLCSMVGASFTVAAAAEVLRSKKGITAVANAQVDTAQSYFGGASALFDGNTDLLSVNGGIFLTADFTIEMWFRSGNTTGQLFGNVLTNTGPVAGQVVCFYAPGNQRLEIYFSDQTSVGYVTNTTMAINTWYHIAMVRSGSTIRCYVNGTQQSATKTFSGELGTTTYPTWHIGGIPGNLDCFNGHIDEIRFSNSARYTAAFTPSTTPFVNDANTVLLIHCDGTDASTFFEDDNGVRASRSLIAIANAQIDTAQYKFSGSALLLDGTGDYVMSPAGTQWNFGTGSFTIEFWIRFNAINTLYVPIALRSGSPINNGEWWCEIEAASNKMYWGFKNQAGTQFYVAFPFGATAFATGQFYHIALVNNAGTAQLYINGTAQGSSTAFTGSFGNSTTDLWVGAGVGGYNLNGWIDEVRISNSARYTAAFTPSTTPFVNDSNTLILMHCDGTDGSTVFRDDNGTGRSQAGIYRENGPVISTAQSKFGGSSLYFPETSGQAINVGYNTIAQGLTNNGDFTVELWAYWTKLPSSGDTGYMMFYSHNPEPYILMANGGVFIGAGGYPSFATTFTTSTWYHIAVSRSSGNLRCFVNGTQIGSTVTGSTYNYIPYTDGLFTRFGKFGDDRGRWQGYMDEIRFSKTARYTANFTAPTAPFQNDANTVLLIHGDGTNNSTVFTDDNGIAPYTP